MHRFVIRGEEFSLRPMKIPDLDEVAQVEADWAPQPWSQASFSRELSVPYSRASVLCRSDSPESVVGYLVRWLVAGEVHLLSIAIRREYRGWGLGGVLLDFVCEEARAERMGFITLEVEAANAIARSLYGSRGFTESRRRRNYYGSGRDAIVLDWRGDAAACHGVPPQ